MILCTVERGTHIQHLSVQVNRGPLTLALTLPLALLE